VEIAKSLVSDIGSTYRRSQMTDAVSDAYSSYVDSHFKFLSEFCPHRSDLIKDIHHLYLLLSPESNSIVGFRYFYFPIEGKSCELLATFIDSEYRRKGYAAQLVRKSIEYANLKGIFRFIVRMSVEKTDERDGLFSFYNRLCAHMCPPNRFTLYYAGKEYEFGL
jgi:GNAT superfamily N-acetyltransferase